jgi:hypothetical protein
MLKRIGLILVLSFYAISAFSAALPAGAMLHDAGPAVVVAHADCDEAGAPVTERSDDSCPDCTRAASPCCNAAFALPAPAVVPPPVFIAYDRPALVPVLQPAARGESIYRPPRG